MESLQIEDSLREMLLPVFGFDHLDELSPEQSLVDDLGVESLDFVEILWMIEDSFGIVLKTDDILGGDGDLEQAVFAESRLTPFGTRHLQNLYPDHAAQLHVGMTKVDIFRLITVRDMANLISGRLGELSQPC